MRAGAAMASGGTLAEPAAPTLKWSELNDDDLSPDDSGARELLEAITGDIKTTYRFETDPATGQLVKVFTKHRLHRNVNRFSKVAQRRKARMTDMQSDGAKDAVYGEDTPIEVAHHLRQLMLDEDDEEAAAEAEAAAGGGGGGTAAGGGHLSLLRKDAVRNKFAQLKRLEAGGADAGPSAAELNETEVEAFMDGFGEAATAAGGGTFADRFRATRRQTDDNTVRVTNLSEEVSEGDLRELFGKFGDIKRVYLAVDKQTNNSKGFAFITFATRGQGQAAISGLNRHGYDSLLMRVEWSKPRAPAP